MKVCRLALFSLAVLFSVITQSSAHADESRGRHLCSQGAGTRCLGPSPDSQRVVVRLEVYQLIYPSFGQPDTTAPGAYLRPVGATNLETTEIPNASGDTKVLRIPMPWLPTTSDTSSVSYVVRLVRVSGQAVFSTPYGDRVVKVSRRNTKLASTELQYDSTGTLAAEVVINGGNRLF